MDEDRTILSFDADELREAEELNTLTDTRMTEEYKKFLEEQLGEAQEPCLPKSDSEDSGSYYEDESMARFDSGFKSNLTEPELSGSFTMNETEED